MALVRCIAGWLWLTAHRLPQLVGNMADRMHERAITHEEGQKFAAANGLLFLETSAKTGQNVEEAFTTVAQTIYEKIVHGVIDPVDFVRPICRVRLTEPKCKTETSLQVSMVLTKLRRLCGYPWVLQTHDFEKGSPWTETPTKPWQGFEHGSPWLGQICQNSSEFIRASPCSSQERSTMNSIIFERNCYIMEYHNSS